MNSWKTSEEEDLDKLNLSNSEKSEERISFIMMNILNFYFFWVSKHNLKLVRKLTICMAFYKKSDIVGEFE